MDVKPANIYVTADNILKIGDFGTCVGTEKWSLDGGEYEGDASYLAPEVLKEGILSPAADLFSFGMTLHRLVTGYCVGTPDLQKEARILRDPRFVLSRSLKDFIIALLSTSPEERLRAHQAMLSSLCIPQCTVLVPALPTEDSLKRSKCRRAGMMKELQTPPKAAVRRRRRIPLTFSRLASEATPKSPAVP